MRNQAWLHFLRCHSPKGLRRVGLRRKNSSVINQAVSRASGQVAVSRLSGLTWPGPLEHEAAAIRLNPGISYVVKLQWPQV
jgi:hypothetical protein